MRYATITPLDENLSEPLLGLSPEQQFKALVDVAHLLGIKVVCEFVFRTASISSDAALEHPDWFYWILESAAKDFAPPVFDEDVLELIKEKVEAGDFTELPAPSEEYISQFTDVPEKVFSENGKIIGITADGQRVNNSRCIRRLATRRYSAALERCYLPEIIR